jgi:hypothetical protein
MGLYCMSPFWCLDFLSGPHIFGKFVHPYINGTAWGDSVDRFNSNGFIVAAMYANKNLL